GINTLAPSAGSFGKIRHSALVISREADRRMEFRFCSACPPQRRVLAMCAFEACRFSIHATPRDVTCRLPAVSSLPEALFLVLCFHRKRKPCCNSYRFPISPALSQQILTTLALEAGS